MFFFNAVNNLLKVRFKKAHVKLYKTRFINNLKLFLLQILESLSSIWQYEREDKLVGLKTILHLCCDNFSFLTSKNLTLNAIQVIAYI